MKPKNTLILLLVAGAIFAFIFFYENNLPTTQQAAERAGKVLEFNRDKITAITIKNTDTQIELRKDKDGAWLMEKPLKDRADILAVSQLFTTAESLKSEASVGDENKGAEKEQLKEFGLSSSETRLTFTGGDKPVEILFGKDAAVEGKLYVRLEGSNVVHVIGNDLKTQVTKKVDEFRDHKLTELTTTKVDKAIFKTAAGEIELDKKNQHWSLAKPLKARGSDQKIGDLISQIANAKVDSFVADSSNLSAFGLQDPRVSITLHSEGEEPPVVLQIGQAVEKEKDKIYVKLSSRDSVLVVPKTLESLADTKPNDVRDQNLMRVESDIVDRMTIESPTNGKIVLARKGEAWTRKDEGKDIPINSAAAKRLLQELQSQKIANFVSDLATELPKYGLDQPKIKVTLSSFASENTSETKSGEKPIVTVLFGNVDALNVYAMLDDEPFVVSVSKSILEFAMADPLQWQELAIYKNKADDIVSVEVTREGQPTVAIERNKDKKWAFANGEGKINEIGAESLVNTLSNLRAVRWAGAATPDNGFDKPLVTVSFKTAANVSGKLVVGARTLDELNYATADGLTGVFALSHPDVSAFEIPLLAKTQAAPATSAAPTPATPTPAAPTPATPTPATPTPPAPATPAIPAPDPAPKSAPPAPGEPAPAVPPPTPAAAPAAPVPETPAPASSAPTSAPSAPASGNPPLEIPVPKQDQAPAK